MPEQTKQNRSGRSNQPTTPEEYPSSPGLPSGDFSYTVEIVMAMQRSLGSLEQAIEGLKLESREYRAKLDDIGKDVHSGKTLIKALLAIATLAIAVFAAFHRH